MILNIDPINYNQTGIYKIINNINGKVYIGSTTNSFYKRWQAYKNLYKQGINKKFLNGIEKYGADNFIFSIIEVIDRCEDIRKKEEQYIVEYNSVVSGYNIKYTGNGGNGGANKGKQYPKPSSDVIERRAANISKSLKGRNKSPQHCLAISNSKKGCKPPHSFVFSLYDTVEKRTLSFSSATEAAKKLGCSIEQVCSLVKGKSKILKRRFIINHH